MPLSPAPPDAAPGWVDRLPPRPAAFARLARFDRPIGIWLLFWPCLAGAFLAPPAGWWPLWPLFLLGAAAMRAAGCVWNDIVDRDLDRQVARTAARPVASGAICVPHALAFLVCLSLVGLAVLVALPGEARIVALASLALVAAYPFTKRVTWWPQAWLGLTFNWGIPVGWAAADPALRAEPAVMLLVYAGAVAWTLGYDSIYAAQDMEDDALAGIRSSARRLGARLRPAIGLFYALAALLLGAGLWRWSASPVAPLAVLPLALHFAWQWRRFDPADPASALAVFRSNRLAGALFVAPVLMSALALAGRAG
jgi:4-hydroxybenzoate polyprenyltransferase